MKTRLLTFLILGVTLLVFSLPSVGKTQEIDDYSSDFIIEIIPNDPRPGETVSAKIISYQFDVNRSVITWTLDGKVIEKGTGKKTANFTLPSLGKESALSVSIVTDSGIETSKTKKFSGGDIDFLWEAQTTVPAGYKGKALPSRKALIKVTGLPHLFNSAGAIARQNLIYEWTLNYKNLPDDSGINRNTLSLRLNDSGDYVVGLKVSTRDKRTSFQKFLHISYDGFKTKLLFYKDDALEGPFYGKALRNKTSLQGKDLNILAEPFFLAEGGTSDYFWTMNDKAAKPGKRPNRILLMKGEGSGQAEIAFEMKREMANSLQVEEGVINVDF
ncbi:hypothetical protein C4572_00315 [Candidatus Parcubacteria bacterium]|nr:MAG: hypothetical protein C4572_00315 [Candidatus Parcubacteria bacterium]